MHPLRYSGVAGPVWYNTENYFFIYFTPKLIWAT